MASRSFILLVADQPAFLAGAATPATRLGITVSRRVGSSVVRNRVKRRIREWFRTHKDQFPAGKDIVVIARPAAAEADFDTLGRELRSALSRLPGADPR